MYYQDTQDKSPISGISAKYVALQESLGTGPGEATLETAPKIHRLVVAQQNQVSPTVYIPGGSMAATVSYIQPKYSYRESPTRAVDTKQGKQTENVSVKEGPKALNGLIKNLLLIALGMALCGIPLVVISTLYTQQKASSYTTNTTTSATIVSLPSQCTSYTTNNDSTRNVASGAGGLCDNTLVARWYRFMGGAGTQLATAYVSRDTCTTWYGGSYSGSLPSTAGATTYGTLCLNNNGLLCYAAWSGASIGVTNCNGYYVYYLLPMLNCNARYCTTA